MKGSAAMTIHSRCNQQQLLLGRQTARLFHFIQMTNTVLTHSLHLYIGIVTLQQEKMLKIWEAYPASRCTSVIGDMF